MYEIPLFVIVRLTSTQNTYFASFAFLTSQKEENFTWVVQTLLDLLNLKDNIPKMIKTNNDTTLMNVVATIFPKTIVLLCRVILLEMI